MVAIQGSLVVPTKSKTRRERSLLTDNSAEKRSSNIRPNDAPYAASTRAPPAFEPLTARSVAKTETVLRRTGCCANAEAAVRKKQKTASLDMVISGNLIRMRMPERHGLNCTLPLSAKA